MRRRAKGFARCDLLCLNLPYEIPYKLKHFSRPSRSPCVTRGGTIYIPYYLALAVAFAKREGYRALLIDAVANDMSFMEVMEHVKSLNPRVIVVDTSTPSIHNDVIMAEALQEACPKSSVVLVGRHVTYDAENTLKACDSVKIVARGYFYKQVLDLLEGKSLGRIRGISYRDGDKIKHKPDAPLPKGEFPFVSEVYKNQLDLRKYFYASCRYPYLMLNFALGCPFNCAFCCEYSRTSYNPRPIDNMIEELKYIKKELPFVKEILFDDPTFVVDEDLICELCDEMIKKGLNVTWSCATRANISYDTLKIMKEAGFRLAHIGIESLNQEALNKINKGMRVEQEVEYLERCEKLGVLNHACFIVGLPSDNPKTIEATIEYAKRLPAIDTIQVFPAIPTPGLPFYEWCKENGYLLTEDYSQWLKPDGSYNVVVSYPWLSREEIEFWIKEFYRRFYFRAKMIMYKIKQSVTSYEEMKRNWMMFKNGIGKI